MSKHIGTVRMRMPNGKPSAITVSVNESGSVDVHMSRSAEGEALLRLPKFAAQQLADFLGSAAGTYPTA